MTTAQIFEADYMKRTGSKVSFVKTENGRVFFSFSGMMFSAKSNKSGKMTTISSQRIEKI